MKPVASQATIKKLFWPVTALALSLLAFVIMALGGQANAAPSLPTGLDANGDVPLPPPTVPPTLGPPSPTANATGIVQTATAIATHISTTPTAPRPEPTGQATIPACTLPFTDVQPADWFYEPVRWMYCHGVVSGYADNTFRPNSSTTRGQLTKIAIGAFNLPSHTESGPHFADVPADNTFYRFVETAYFYSIVTGYPCGDPANPGEPCDPQNHPYFRPDNLITRSQLTKISVLTAIQANPSSWQLLNPPLPSFNDVPPGSPFYTYIETAAAHNILQGYDCGGEGEPCPGRYFHPGSNGTRAQLSKIIVLAVTQP